MLQLHHGGLNGKCSAVIPLQQLQFINKHFFLIFRNQHCPKRASNEGQPKYSRNERLARKISDLFVVEVEPAGR